MSGQPLTMKEDDALYVNVGRLTRQLHDALRELGYDRDLESAVGSLPDARSRLSYISRLTGEAAEKVLNGCLLYTSPSPRDGLLSRMPSSA